jgi:hypothetical protein
LKKIHYQKMMKIFMKYAFLIRDGIFGNKFLNLQLKIHLIKTLQINLVDF